MFLWGQAAKHEIRKSPAHVHLSVVCSLTCTRTVGTHETGLLCSDAKTLSGTATFSSLLYTGMRVLKNRAVRIEVKVRTDKACLPSICIRDAMIGMCTKGVQGTIAAAAAAAQFALWIRSHA